MKFAIAISGRVASGKSTIATLLASEYDLKTVSFGEYVRSISRQTGELEARDSLQQLGNNLISTLGASGLLQAALKHSHIQHGDSVVFDGVRHSEILDGIRRSSSNCLAVFLHASLKQRHRRYNARLHSPITLDEFLVVDEHPVELGISELVENCDVTIDAARPAAEIQSILRYRLLPFFRPDDGKGRSRLGDSV